MLWKEIREFHVFVVTRLLGNKCYTTGCPVYFPWIGAMFVRNMPSVGCAHEKFANLFYCCCGASGVPMSYGSAQWNSPLQPLPDLAFWVYQTETQYQDWISPSVWCLYFTARIETLIPVSLTLRELLKETKNIACPDLGNMFPLKRHSCVEVQRSYLCWLWNAKVFLNDDISLLGHLCGKVSNWGPFFCRKI